MASPINSYPFEHNGEQYEVRVFGEGDGYKLFIYKGDVPVTYRWSGSLDYDIAEMFRLDWKVSGIEAIAEHLIELFKNDHK
ncbi:hypothetical protein [Herpetosiphon sp. NSE202]|uniref:hypothetical protein n=1 Tax=Herpetosiphon sp. NSE202 TaxID=3351349 RepID=UPI003641FC60